MTSKNSKPSFEPVEMLDMKRKVKDVRGRLRDDTRRINERLVRMDVQIERVQSDVSEIRLQVERSASELKDSFAERVRTTSVQFTLMFIGSCAATITSLVIALR
jgi:hypothetical protein